MSDELSTRTTISSILVGALAQNLPQRNIGWRLGYVLASESLAPASGKLLGSGGSRHQ